MHSAEFMRTVMASALVLLAGTLTFLYLGHFIQFDDTSGFGNNEWVMPFGVVAGFAATASMVVACFDTRVRRVLGGVLFSSSCWWACWFSPSTGSGSYGRAGRVNSGTS